MAKPTTASAYATITNPSTSLTDFSLIINLANLPAATMLDWNTNEGGRGRAYKNGTETELACDFIDPDYVAGTGLLRVKWTGTLASSGTQQVQVFLPHTGNTAYGVSDTYGQYNAYNSMVGGYWPDGGGVDRTSNGLDGTETGTVTFGDTTLSGYTATTYGSGYSQISTTEQIMPTAEPSAMFALIDTVNITDTCTLFGANSYNFYAFSTSGNAIRLFVGGGFNGDEDIRNSGIRHIGFRRSGAGGGDEDTIYIDGAIDKLGGFLGTAGTGLTIGANISGSSTTPAVVSQVLFFNDDPGEALVIHEELQTSDNTAFWGTWINVPVGPTGNTPTNYYKTLLQGAA